MVTKPVDFCQNKSCRLYLKCELDSKALASAKQKLSILREPPSPDCPHSLLPPAVKSQFQTVFLQLLQVLSMAGAQAACVHRNLIKRLLESSGPGGQILLETHAPHQTKSGVDPQSGLRNLTHIHPLSRTKFFFRSLLPLPAFMPLLGLICV